MTTPIQPSDSTQGAGDTPRTDAADNFTTMTGHLVTCIRDGEYVYADFARKLERETNTLPALVQRVEELEGLIKLFIQQVAFVELWDEGDFIVIMNGQNNKTGFIVGRHEANLIRALTPKDKATE